MRWLAETCAPLSLRLEESGPTLLRSQAAPGLQRRASAQLVQIDRVLRSGAGIVLLGSSPPAHAAGAPRIATLNPCLPTGRAMGA